MQAKIVDLRYRMNDVLKALERNEEVSILYHGQLKGIIRPAKSSFIGAIKDHPFFNMHTTEQTVEEQMEELRGGRYRAL